MEKIKTKPASNEYRDNFDRIFRRSGEVHSIEEKDLKPESTLVIKTVDEDIVLD